MNSHRKDSFLYDPDTSLTEEPEIYVLSVDLENYWHLNDDRSFSHVYRHSDSRISSVR